MDIFDKKLLDSYTHDTQICSEKHEDADLFIYGYYPGLIKGRISWDSVNVNCRGLIINSKGKVKSRPFNKFFTFREYISPFKVRLSENQIARVPKCKFRILEKVDGTMTTLYWVNNTPFLATQRSFHNIKAQKATEILHEKYSHLFHKIKRDRTYIFEAIYPETKILIDYGEREDVILIGVIDNKTGEDLPLEDIGFPLAKDYTAKYGHITNFNELIDLNLPNEEGFVITYENGFRIKVKFPWYQDAHRTHSYLTTLHTKVYNCYLELADRLNIRMDRVSNMLIWKTLKEGKDLDVLYKNIPNELYSCGISKWIENESNKLQMKYSSLDVKLSITEKWDKIKPQKEAYFNYMEEKPLPKNNIIMWDFHKRFRETRI